MNNVGMHEVNTKLLIKAVGSGLVAEVKRLLEQDIDVNQRDSFGNTALMIATINGSTEIMNLLLDRGAAIDLPRPSYGKTALMLAAEAGVCEAARTLLKRGATVDLRTTYGATALTMASVKGYPEIVELLINYGADVNPKNNEGTTPLMWAADNGHLEVTKHLLESGADVNATEGDGFTALWVACFKNYKEIVRLMLEAGASVNHRDGLGSTALIMACSMGHKDIVRILIDAGADVNLKNQFGETALHTASERGFLEIVDLLLKNGAHAHVRDENDGTPIERAYEKGHFDVVELLKAHGADRTAPFLSEEEIAVIGRIRMFVWTEVKKRGGSEAELLRLLFETDTLSKFRREVKDMVSKYRIPIPTPILSFFKDRGWTIGNGKQPHHLDNSAEGQAHRTCRESEIESPRGMDLKLGQKTGRNDLCPCGSGKKYKKCCYANGRDEAQKILGSEKPSTETGLNLSSLHHLEVGKPYVPGKTRWAEACEYNFRVGGHELRLFYGNPRQEEIKRIRKGKAEFALFVKDGMIFLLYKFEGAGWSDAPYHWWIVPEDLRDMPELNLTPNTRALLQILLVGANTGILHALRAVSLSPQFTRELHQAIYEQTQNLIDRNAYTITV